MSATEENRTEQKKALLCPPQEARLLIPCLAGLIVMTDGLADQPLPASRPALLTIAQQGADGSAALQFSYDLGCPGLSQRLQKQYAWDSRFSLGVSGWLRFQEDRVQSFSPQWVNGFDVELAVIAAFQAGCPYARPTSQVSRMDKKGRLSCMLQFELGRG